jgi:hypothetical protein
MRSSSSHGTHGDWATNRYANQEGRLQRSSIYTERRILGDCPVGDTSLGALSDYCAATCTNAFQVLEFGIHAKRILACDLLFRAGF